ncbi:MAG: hypothetical protein ACOZAO_03285 [Patescibacteria group bacterium]
MSNKVIRYFWAKLGSADTVQHLLQKNRLTSDIEILPPTPAFDPKHQPVRFMHDTTMPFNFDVEAMAPHTVDSAKIHDTSYRSY